VERFHWSASAGRYLPDPPANRRYFGNIAFLISLGVSEEQVTGEIDASGVSYAARLAMLQPRARVLMPMPGAGMPDSRIAESPARPHVLMSRKYGNSVKSSLFPRGLENPRV
jgi:hypothetical protein